MSGCERYSRFTSPPAQSGIASSQYDVWKILQYTSVNDYASYEYPSPNTTS
jgi:hypothetical protein